jgi:hypothetical protein
LRTNSATNHKNSKPISYHLKEINRPESVTEARAWQRVVGVMEPGFGRLE